ncbi:MAG: S8 family peptidase [Flavobacteriaceae bacterium]|nr:S8 family peptidase [Flavobacteriaceae bacterium]
MPNKHVYLNNKKNKKNGFNRKRGFSKPEAESEEEKIEPVIPKFRIDGFRTDYANFNQAYENRYAKRTIEFPSYIDLVEIRFFSVFSLDLKNKFYTKYGLLPVSYSDFNKTVRFEIDDDLLFQNFKNDLEYIISYDDELKYSGKRYNLIALIYKFSFIDKRKRTTDTSSLIISTIQSNAVETAIIQLERLKSYLNSNQVAFSFNESEDLIYLNEASQDVLKTIEDNFDIVKAITSSKALKVRPGLFGTMHTEYGFQVEVPENLPTVAIIDTGVNVLEPFTDLILEDGINVTNQNMYDANGHGTLVAGLAIFGNDLPSSVQETYRAKCKILPIKALHSGTDGINFPLLVDAIKEANQEYGVRFFNMSLSFHHKNYNESYSDFAFELDKLAYELDILIFISVGNFDDTALIDLLTASHHKDHNYPEFFYKLDGNSPVHSCETTNICTPSDSLNNISIGALAGNLDDEDNSDITPYNIYPAYYTRKFNFDYEQKINETDLKRNQKNKHLNKPDLVFDGGDLSREESGLEVLADLGRFFQRTTGTSLSTPLITSMAAEILHLYPDLDTQSIKALLINCAGYFKSEDLPDFENKSDLLKKLIGFGIPDKMKALFSDENTIAMIIEDQIKPQEILSIPIYLPDYLKKSGNKLIFTISLAYSFPPDKGNHLSYLPLHISFNLVRNVSISAFDGEKEDYMIKSGISWSEDHFGIGNRLFSNAQRKEYRLQPKDIQALEGGVAIAIRCLNKTNIDESLKDYLEQNSHSFSLVIEIKEELKNETESQLYNEVIAINDVSIIGETSADSVIDLDI